MPGAVRLFVRYVEALNRRVGRMVMYLNFVMIGVLLVSSIARTAFDLPLLWVVEVAQMTMAAYYLLGGAYSMQLDAHVRMDVLYCRGHQAAGLHRHHHLRLSPLLHRGPHVRRLLEHELRAGVRPAELFGLGAVHGADQDHHDVGHRPDVAAGNRHVLQGPGQGARGTAAMMYEVIALLMFSSMLLMLVTGQRVFGGIGCVASAFALALWGVGGVELPFAAAFTLFNWYPLLTLPLFIYMGYMLSESGIANDLYDAFHVWCGPLPGGLAVGTIGLMIVISAMNGLSVAGMAIGASIALPEMLRRGYDKIMITGVIQAGSSLGILVPPSVVLVLYAMIARQPVGQLWLAGVFPGLMLAGLFMLYILVRCWIQPELGPPLPVEQRQMPLIEKLKLLRAGILPILIFFAMTGLFIMGVTSLVESSAVGATAATVAALEQYEF